MESYGAGNLTMEQFDNKKMRDCPSPVSHRGFTLVELLVSIFIIMLMSGIIFANYRGGRQEFALQRSANKLAQDIRRAQEMAMSAREIWDDVQGKYVVPEGGYGVTVKTTPSPPTKTYTLFGDANEVNNHSYGAGDYFIEEIEVEKGVIIKSLQVSVGVKNKIHITFVPPDPKVYITPAGEPPTSWCKITLALEQDLEKTKTITVNKVGSIEID